MRTVTPDLPCSRSLTRGVSQSIAKEGEQLRFSGALVLRWSRRNFPTAWFSVSNDCSETSDSRAPSRVSDSDFPSR